MARQTVNIGTSANKGNGDPLRTAFTKINNNFNELYAGTTLDPANTAASLIPATDGLYDLGSSTKQWADLHVKDFIHLGGKKISMSAAGTLLVNNNIVQVTDVVGSVFADDSKLMMDGLTGTLYGPMIGDVTGSVFGDDSTIMVDGVAGKIVGPIETTSLRTSEITIAIGQLAGNTNQATTALAIGGGSGMTNQSTGTVAIGYAAARVNQGVDAVAIGQSAGDQDQGASAVAIGGKAGLTSQAANSIVLNATGSNLNNTVASSFVVKPIRSATMTTILGYDAASGEIMHNAAIPGYTNTADLKALVAASTDFADYQTRIAAL